MRAAQESCKLQARGAFAKRVGDYLEKARAEQRFDQLVLVAPPIAGAPGLLRERKQALRGSISAIARLADNKGA